LQKGGERSAIHLLLFVLPLHRLIVLFFNPLKSPVFSGVTPLEVSGSDPGYL
jgi:hypothetical protein